MKRIPIPTTPSDRLFAETKLKMVMRIYGVSRARALELIAERKAAKAAANGESQAGGKKDDGDETFMSAEDFFA